MTRKELETLAGVFLKVADKHNDGCSAFMCGSSRRADVSAYCKVKTAYRNFIKAYNEYYDESNDDCIDYELAYSVLG